MARRLRAEPTPGSTTTRCTDPPPKWRVPAKSMNAPAPTSKGGTSWLTSTSTALGQPARTMAFIAATRGEPVPKSVVSVTSGGPAVAPCLPVAGLLPGISFVVIAALLPEPKPVALHELQTAQPLGRLPEVFRRHEQAECPAVVWRQLLAVPRVAEQVLPLPGHPEG